MKSVEGLAVGQPLACLADVSERSWALLGLGELPCGSCYVADVTDLVGAVGSTGAAEPTDVTGSTCRAESIVATNSAGTTESADTPNAPDARSARIVAFFDGETGDVFPCLDGRAEPHRDDGPAVHVIGALHDATGQVTVRQERGNYLRICRWDRVDSDAPLLQGALLRTLPQCGCGGSLGAPKLFSSFAEMGAYHFCAFYHHPA